MSTDPEASRVLAVAEAVEAYCGASPVTDDCLVRASFRELAPRAVSPQRFAWPSKSQYEHLAPLRRMTGDRVVDWCIGWSLTHEHEVLVPAALVYADRGRRPPNDLLPEQGSTGLACHVSVPEAVLGGLCEVLERDALAITWYNALPVTALSVEGTPLEELMARLRSEASVVMRLFSLPTDGPFPVVLAVARSSTGPPFAAVGAACRSELATAAAKAVVESTQVLVRLDATGRDLDPEQDAAARYATADGANLLERNLVATAEETAQPPSSKRPPESRAADLSTAVDHLARNGLEVIVTEVTTPDVAQAGWRVMRVLVPGAVWPGTNPELAPLGAARLYQLPVRLNLRGRQLEEQELRPLPVPLA